MKFSIGTASSNMEFEEDIRLIKSSLLYADEIELIGMAEYAIFNYLPKCLTSASDVEIVIKNLISLLGAFDNEDAKEMVKQLEEANNKLFPFLPQLKKKGKRSKQEILAQWQLRESMGQFRAELNTFYNEFMNTHGINKIQELINRNIISVYDYSYNGFSLMN